MSVIPLHIMAIDPGISGAIALLEIGDQSVNLLKVWDIPTLSYGVAGTTKHKVDAYKLATLIDTNCLHVKMVFIEEVGVMSGHEGRVSMFNFGHGAGVIEGVISSNFIPIKKIKPSVWKSAMGLTRLKKDSRDKASKIFPDHRELFKRAKDDGRAEAALLGWYGSSFLVNQVSNSAS